MPVIKFERFSKNSADNNYDGDRKIYLERKHSTATVEKTDEIIIKWF